MPCIAQVVGRILTAVRISWGNSSSGYQQPPRRAMTIPVTMLTPLACPSVLTKVPSVVPRAAAASAEVTSRIASATGAWPQFTFMTTIPNPTSRSICTRAVATWPAIVPIR